MSQISVCNIIKRHIYPNSAHGTQTSVSLDIGGRLLSDWRTTSEDRQTDPSSNPISALAIDNETVIHLKVAKRIALKCSHHTHTHTHTHTHIHKQNSQLFFSKPSFVK